MKKRVFSLIDANYNKSTKVSFATIKYRGNEYTAFTKLHEEDKDKESKYAGCRFAEQKAQINALKAELRDEKVKCDAIKDYVKSVCQYSNFDKNSPTAKAMFKQLNTRIKRVNALVDEINQMIQDYDTDIRQRDVVTAAIQRKKENENG